MKKIVTFGEILLRLSTHAGKRLHQAGQLSLNYGGAEANVAVSLSNYGYDVHLVSKIPDNPLGKAAERHFQSYRVHTDYLLKGGERLGTYYLETGVGERSARVVYDRKNSSISGLTIEELDVEEIFSDTALFHVTGITPAVSPSLKEITLLLLQKAKERGVLTSFDFNYRSRLWSHREAAETIKEYLPYVDICSCGELDAIYLLGIEPAEESLQFEEKLIYYYKRIQELYPNINYLCSTLREVHSASSNELQGNLYWKGSLYQSKIHHLEPIVDRVGGGDAFLSGIIYGILEEMDLEETVSFATGASALKHTVYGDCNIFSKEEILDFVASGSGKIVR